MIPVILNFSHPLTQQQLHAVVQRVGMDVTERRVAVHVQPDESMEHAALRLLRECGLSSESWQGQPILTVLPGLSPLAACLITGMHGLSGYFPAVIVIRPNATGLPGVFSVTEIVNLQNLRLHLREHHR